MKKIGMLCFMLLLLLPLPFAEAGHYHNGLFFYDDAYNYLRITHYSGSGVTDFADLTSATKVQTNDSEPNGTFFIKREDSADYTGDYYRLPEAFAREAQYIEACAYRNMRNRN